MSLKLRHELEKFFGETRRVGYYFNMHRVGWVVLFILGAAYTGLGLLSPILIKQLIDKVLVAGDVSMLNFIILLFVFIALAVAALNIMSSWLFARLQQTMLVNVRNDLFDHIEQLDMGYFEKKDTGDLLSRLIDDVNGVAEFVEGIFQSGIMNVLTLIFIFAFAFMLNPLLTILSILVIPMLIISQKYYSKIVRAGYTSIRKREADFLGFLQEKLSTISLTKVFSEELIEQKKESLRAKKLARLAEKLTLTSAIASAIASLFVFAALLSVLWLGGLDVIRGILTIGSLVAIYTYITMMFGPVDALADLNLELQGAIVKVNRVFAVLDQKPRIVDKKGAKPLKVSDGIIKFNKVNFSYQKGKPSVENISFELQPGETVGIVGPSGSGKTTVAKLLVRLYDPDSGQITIDNQNIKDVKLASLHSVIGVVKQDIVILRGTIKENIAYGMPDAGLDDIVKAAKIAHAHEFIMKLPHGYNTIIGTGAIELSGGQAQRISIARMLLKNPKILIFDEPASALDTEVEAKIEESLRHLKKDKTMIVITHRLHSMKSADRLIVLDKGKIAEIGNFEQLMKKRGVFYKMYTMEFGGFHAFTSRMDYELKHAVTYRKPVCIAGLRIKNLEAIHKQIGREKLDELLDKIEHTTAEFVKEPDLSAPDPHHLDLLYVGLPSMHKPIAKQKLMQLARRIEAESPVKLVLSFDMAVSPDEGTATDELLHKVRSALATKR